MNASNKQKSKIEANSRKAKLWSPFAKRLILSGVRRDDHDGNQLTTLIEREPKKKLGALASAWEPTFRKKLINENLAKSFLTRFGRPFDFSECIPPNRDTIRGVIDRAINSATGKDGIPYEGWKQAGEAGVDTLSNILEDHLSNAPSPEDFNDGIFVFPPKR